jgi:IS1 family transposase
MNKLDTAARAQIIKCLVDGVGVNATCRIAGVAKNTVLKFLAEVGAACETFHNEKVRGLTCKRIQCDEIWSFCRSKEKNVAFENKGTLGFGDVWTFTGIDADTKLMVSWLVGFREATWANKFMLDVADRVTNRIQLTTDGLRAYLKAVDNAFGDDVDYSMLVKMYGEDRSGAARYSPAKIIGVKQMDVCGEPERAHCSTSYVERSNLTMRMNMRRFTRLTNAFSKKIQNHKHAIALNFVHYNFCRIHQTLRITPAMAAGLADHVWEVEEIVGMVEAQEQAAIDAGALKRGKYKTKPA